VCVCVNIERNTGRTGERERASESVYVFVCACENVFTMEDEGIAAKRQ